MKSYYLRVSILGLLAMTPLAWAADNAADNAALKYWPAYFLMPRTDQDLNILRNWQSAPLDSTTAKLLDDSKRSLDYLHAGASIQNCDWGLDLSQGPGLLLPHLNASRCLAQLACLRVRYELQQQQYTAAVDDACDIFTCARQSGRESFLVGLLVQDMMDQMAIDALALGLDKFDADALQHLTDRLGHLPDGFTLADEMQFQKEMEVDWLVQRIQAAGASPNWDEVLAPMLFGDSTGDALAKAAGGTPQAVLKQVQRLGSFIDDVTKLLAEAPTNKHFDPQYATLVAQYSSDPFVELTKSNMPSVVQRVNAGKVRMALLRDAVAVVQHGAAALDGLHDPVDQLPIKYEAAGSGFRLVTQVMDKDGPVTLTIGDGN